MRNLRDNAKTVPWKIGSLRAPGWELFGCKK